MSTSKYAEKIQALLAKAEGTDNEAERESFTAAAERLMIKWGIDDAMLSDAEKRRKEKTGTKIVERRYEVTERGGALLARFVAARAAQGIAPVRTLVSQQGKSWWCIGYEDDLARIEMYIPSILRQAASEWKEYSRPLKGTYQSRREAYRRSFFMGFGGRVKERLAEIFREETEQGAPGTELVLRDRKDSVDEKTRELYPHLRTIRSTARVGDAYGAGVSAGNAATLSAGALT